MVRIAKVYIINLIIINNEIKIRYSGSHDAGRSCR